MAIDDQTKKYEELYNRAIQGRNINDIYSYKKNCEEFYFNDVDSTLSQFTKKQKKTIIELYNLPISTKITYPIVEQIIAFLTGLKPFPRLLAPEESLQQYTEIYERAYHAIWYESHTDKEVTSALRDWLTTGSGFLYVREADFYTESTFNVIIEHIHWKNVLLDPDCKKSDLSDCEYAIIYEVMRAGKAERKYDIDLNEEGIFKIGNYGNLDPNILDDEEIINAYETQTEKKNKYVVLRHFNILEQVNVYISQDGDISIKRPKKVHDVPNPELPVIEEQINSLKISIEKLLQASSLNKQQVNTESMQNMSQGIMNDETIANEVQNQEIQLQKLLVAYKQMPKTIIAFEMLLEDETKKIIYEYSKDTRKRIKYVLMAGKNIIYEKYKRLDRVPLVHFSHMMKSTINRTYGLVHFFKDLVSAMNKLWALTLLELMTHGNRKIITPKGAFQDLKKTEDQYAKPGSAFIEYEPNPALEHNGKPEPMEPSPINQNISLIIQQFLILIEYITGINSVIQGNPQNAPETFGATQTLQEFGTQRVKLYSRSLESTFEDLALIVVQFIQQYTPMDKFLYYFDENGDKQEVKILKDTEDTKFKVRVQISQSLPTIRLMFANLLGNIAGQTKNPYVADALTKLALDLTDMPEGKKLSEEIDTIKMLEQQLQQLQQKLQEAENQNKMLTNNMQEQQVSANIKQATQQVKSDIDLAANDQMNKMEIENNQQQNTGLTI